MTIVATSAVEGVSLTPTPTRKGRAASPKSGTVTKRDLRPGGSAESVWKKQVVGSTSCELTGMILARWRVAMSEEEKSGGRGRVECSSTETGEQRRSTRDPRGEVGEYLPRLGKVLRRATKKSRDELVGGRVSIEFEASSVGLMRVGEDHESE